MFPYDNRRNINKCTFCYEAHQCVIQHMWSANRKVNKNTAMKSKRSKTRRVAED